MKRRFAASGERTRLACSFRRLAERKKITNPYTKVVNAPPVCGEAPHTTREARALPGVVVAALFAIIGIAAVIWLCLPKPPLMDDVSFSQTRFRSRRSSAPNDVES